MHPLIERIGAIRREKAEQQWEPERIVLGWLTCDALRDDLHAREAFVGAPDGGRDAILGIPVVRDVGFPIGGCVAFKREYWISPKERREAHLAVLL